MSSQRPLLASRASSDHSDERAEAEDALLTGQQTGKSQQRKQYGWKFWREVGLFAWALIATIAVIVVASVYQHNVKSGLSRGQQPVPSVNPPIGKRNLIFMVSDGMGPTSLSMTRSFRQKAMDLPIDNVLVLDSFLIGSSRTRSSSSLITDSAAGATAFSCGKKSYNGAISVLPDHTPCGTVLEAAKKAGYATGLVVTTRITDATPACFAAHVNTRGEEDRIAEQEVGDYPLGVVLDLIFGGGRCHFLPNTTDGSCREDDRDVIEMAKKNGFTYSSTRKEFDQLKTRKSLPMPYLGLFAGHDIPYEVDRRQINDQYPSLDEMTNVALKALEAQTKDSDKGFFVMIEGSRIDHAGHANDPVAQVHEVLAYDKAFNSVLNFIADSKVPTIVISTSDHETGGLATARQLHTSYPEYLWYPGVLTNASHSAESLTSAYHDYLEAAKRTPTTTSVETFIKSTLLLAGLGIQDASKEELDLLKDQPDIAAYALSDMISRRAEIGWTTHGHSAVDVNIYGSAGTEYLRGNHENTEIGKFMSDWLEVDVDAITKELLEKGTSFDSINAAGERESWLGKPLEHGKVLDKLDCYHGDFKHKH
ncbi:MAG: hypothetical protein M1814_004877 [Vezdaea aestivalis]|nr:MAG: hypothetical protein M1814_004877 [Vezdaea aestivalis]